MNTQFRLALRNARRNVRRTLLTAGTVLVGTAFTTVTLAWISGIFGDMTSAWVRANGDARIVTEVYAAKEEMQPLYANIAEATPVLAKLRQVPGVVSAEPRVSMGVVVSVGEEIGEDYAMLVGSTDSWYRDTMRAPEKVVAGTWLTGAKGEVVLGRKVAKEVGATVGQDVLLLGQTQYGSMSPISAKVVGVVASDAAVDLQAFVTLEDARWMVDAPDGAIEILVYGESEESEVVGPLVERVRDALGPDSGLLVRAWYEQDLFASTLPIISGMKTGIGVIVMFVMILAIFNTMTMSVLERTAEIGVMRALGQSRSGAVGSFLVEAAVIGLVGGVLGVAIGSAGAAWLEHVGVSLGEEVIDKMDGAYPMTATLYARLSPDVALTALTVGFLTALLGAVLPALRAASIEPSIAMKSKR
jgi:putative ABC transport system permease protein